VLLHSPSDRQSGELAAQVFGYSGVHGQPIGSRKRTELQQHLVNGDRVIALPTNEKTIRGFLGARLLVVDEMSRVSDALYPAVRPLLAVSRGRHQQPNAVADRRWHSLETTWCSIGWGTYVSAVLRALATSICVRMSSSPTRTGQAPWRAECRHAEMKSRRSAFYSGPLDLSTFRLDAKLRRCVRPEQVAHLRFVTSVEPTEAS
jgi:hypothetical protein